MITIINKHHDSSGVYVGRPTVLGNPYTLKEYVQRRKISFGTQSEAGSRFVARMMTVVATLQPPQRHVLASLPAAHAAARRGEAAPSLLPACEMASHAVA